MFEPKTQKIREIHTKIEKPIEELNRLFGVSVGVYIDYANVKQWSERTGFHIDITRLYQFLDSFMFISDIGFYQGILEGDEDSERIAKTVKNIGYRFVTKPVKIMKHSIDTSSIQMDSPYLLNDYIRKNLLRKLNLDDIRYLNEILRKMNKEGILYLEDRKCNFDVEISIDMLLDSDHDNYDTYVLWTGDSDFCDPIKRIIEKGHRVILFASSGCVARELNAMRSEGLIIFDIKKIREYICWNREIPNHIYSLEKPKGTSFEAP